MFDPNRDGELLQPRTSQRSTRMDPKQKTAYVHQFQLSVQYQLSKDYSLDIGYVGNRSRNLLFSNDIGSNGLALARNSTNQFINSAILYTNGASANYDSLQIQLQKRLSRNIQGQVSYTWGHAIDNSTGIFNGLGEARNGRGGPADPANLTLDRGNSSLDVRHLLSADAIIDLPFGKGKRFLNSSAMADKILGGFQVNVIETARSGLPYSITCSNCNGAVRPSIIGDPFANVTAGRLLNRAAFTNNPNTYGRFVNPAGNTIFFGNLGRNTFKGPAIFNTDFSIFKNTAITERVRTQIGIEFFNLFNHANYTVPNNNIDFNDPNNGFGEIKNNAYPGRVIQYRLKLLF